MDRRNLFVFLVADSFIQSSETSILSSFANQPRSGSCYVDFVTFHVKIIFQNATMTFCPLAIWVLHASSSGVQLHRHTCGTTVAIDGRHFFTRRGPDPVIKNTYSSSFDNQPWLVIRVVAKRHHDFHYCPVFILCNNDILVRSLRSTCALSGTPDLAPVLNSVCSQVDGICPFSSRRG